MRKIFLILLTTIITFECLFLTKDEEIVQAEPVLKEEQIVTVHKSDGQVINIPMNEYLIGVVGAEMPASFDIEALKAQAVTSRTYALYKINHGDIITDSISTQVYYDNDKLKEKWGSDFDKYYNKIKEAVTSTDKEVITYNGEIINALFHSVSNGKTEDCINVFSEDLPYLKSVESSEDLETTMYYRENLLNLNDVLNILDVDNLDMEVLERTSSGRIDKVKIGSKTYTGKEVRSLLNLRSTDFEFELQGDQVLVKTNGYGHGVGMSQYGAGKLASQGYSYQEILKHYYSGVEIVKL